MKIPQPWCIDFETEGIAQRPEYPPKPVGVAIKRWGKKSKYLAWGHPTNNNCKINEARMELARAYNSGEPLLFHNSKFDVDVANEHLGFEVPDWKRIHDTLFLLFLDDPRAESFSLKPSAERILNLPPEEQEAVRDWLLARQPIPGVKISVSKTSDHFWAKYICLAPGDLVGRYACGDVDRTELLFRHLYPTIEARGMMPAYDRERELMPILLESESHGVRVHLKKLRDDVAMYTRFYDSMTSWVRARLGVGNEVNLDSGAQLVAAMTEAGVVDVDKLGVTPRSGKPRSDKASREAAISDPSISAALRWRTQLGTCLHTYMEPWLKTAERSGGLIYTTWNQTRGEEDGGTRTGRLSASRFQNIPNEFAPSFRTDPKDKSLPKSPIPNLPKLPQVRSYVVPYDKGHVLFGRDYSQQELRVLAHFEDEKLAERYHEDPWLDVHSFIQQMVSEATGRKWERKPIKNTVFGLIYGMGVGKMALKSDISVMDAKFLKDSILRLFPKLKQMYRDMRARARAKQPIHTWGGREYYCEDDKLINGRVMQFDYKLINLLVQGSSACITKEAMIRWNRIKDPSTRFLMNIHDELLASTPKSKLKKEMENLRVAMESIELDVPLLSEGYSGDNWADLDDYDKAGKRVA